MRASATPERRSAPIQRRTSHIARR
jgi:hypothetical protein